MALALETLGLNRGVLRAGMLGLVLLLAACGANGGGGKGGEGVGPRDGGGQDAVATGGSGGRGGSGADAATATGGSAPSDAVPVNGDGGTPVTIAPTGEMASATITEAGGEVVLQTATRRFALKVPPRAIFGSTVIKLEVITLPADPDGAAVRMSPSGLSFELPALLEVKPPPAGGKLLGLAFYADKPGAEMSFPLVANGAATIPIFHFSEAVIGLRQRLRQFVAAFQAEQIDAVELGESSSLELGAHYFQAIEPMLRRARNNLIVFRTALSMLGSWATLVQTLGVDDEPAVPLGSNGKDQVKTLGELFVQGQDLLSQNGIALLADRTFPRCVRGDDIKKIGDWVDMPLELARIASIGGAPLTIPPLCARAEVRVSVDDVIGADETAVRLFEVKHVLVGPDTIGGEGEELIPSTAFSVTVTGASGPSVIAAPSGKVVDIDYTRATAPATHGMAFTITATAPRTEEGSINQKGATFTVQDNLMVGVEKTPISLSEKGTVEMCATATVDRVPLATFNATFALLESRGGSLNNTEATAQAGRACVIYASQDPFPVFGGDARFNVTVEASGAKASTKTSLFLNTDNELFFSDGDALVVGKAGTICGRANLSFKPAAGVNMTFSASQGTFEPAGGVTGEEGKVCVKYTPSKSGSARVTLRGEVNGGSGSTTTDAPVAPSPVGIYDGGCQIEVGRLSRSVSGQSTVATKNGAMQSTFEILPDLSVVTRSAKSAVEFSSSCPGGSSRWTVGVKSATYKLASNDLVISFVYDMPLNADDRCNSVASSTMETSTLKRRVLTDTQAIFGVDSAFHQEAQGSRLDDVASCVFVRR